MLLWRKWGKLKTTIVERQLPGQTHITPALLRARKHGQTLVDCHHAHTFFNLSRCDFRKKKKNICPFLTKKIFPRNEQLDVFIPTQAHLKRKSPPDTRTDTTHTIRARQVMKFSQREHTLAAQPLFSPSKTSGKSPLSPGSTKISACIHYHEEDRAKAEVEGVA